MYLGFPAYTMYNYTVVSIGSKLLDTLGPKMTTLMQKPKRNDLVIQTKGNLRP